MLKGVVSFLNLIKVDYILDGGTLLGIVRENRLLPWDTDIDLSIRGEDAELVIKRRWILWLLGYRTRIRRFPSDMGPFKRGQARIIKVQTHFLSIKKHDVIDIFVKWKIDGEYLNMVGSPSSSIVRNFPPCYLEDLGSVTYKNRTYKTPKDINGYLTRIYGDWRTPVKEWDFKKDNKCVKMRFNEQGEVANAESNTEEV